MVDIMSDKQREADAICNSGIDLYDEKEIDSAHQHFKKAYSIDPESAKINSYYGLTLGLVDDKVQKGLELCKKAIMSNIPDPLFYRNIALLYLRAANKPLAVAAFHKGLSIDKSNRKIIVEYRKIGIRRKPFFSFLSRNFFLNIWLGKLTWRYNKNKHLYKT